MLASKAMIYTGSTTGLEVAVLGTPTLSLVPGDNLGHSSAISNVANATARTVEEALGRVIAHLGGSAASLLADMRALDYSDYLVLAPETLPARRVLDALAVLYGKLTLVPTSNPSTIEASRDAPLQDWQSHKYAITLQPTRRPVASVSAALGYSDAVEVNVIAGSAILIRAV